MRGAWAGRGLLTSKDGGSTWSDPADPANGAVFDISFSEHWSNDGRALAGMWQGVWATTDSGDSWYEVSSFESGGIGMISAVAISPDFASDQTYLAGGSYGVIFRSINARATWSNVADSSSLRRVVFHPGDGTIALAAAGDGLWRSTDGAATWSHTLSDEAVLDVVFRPLHNTVYASLAAEVIRSTDGGDSWHSYSPGLAATHLGALGVSEDGAGLFVANGAIPYRYDFDHSLWEALPAMPDGQSILRFAVSPDYDVDATLLGGQLMVFGPVQMVGKVLSEVRDSILLA
ncbi:MAG: hypothetical protein GY759_24955 [Chloroflexi bacterium]|nr:hypothetical protein [Chloroflexota bacterium]